MKIKLWGVRGSIPTTTPDTKFYGGQTSCIFVSEEDTHIVLDAGSGIQEFNSVSLPVNNRIDVLLTHLHMDHIQGLGFFKALFIPDLEVHIWGPMSNSSTLHSRLSRYLSPPLFPVLLRDLPCKLILHEIGNGEFDIGPFKITAAYIIHPGPTLGYRIKGKHSVFTYIPDHEPALGDRGMIHNSKWTSGFDIASGADLLYHDGQYTTQEYDSRKGWGHSSFQDVLEFASLTGIKHLLIGHHDPTHSDTRLNEIVTALKKNNSYPFQYELAKEGMEFELP
jgi:ribonuclease BN (tRNA processing enzyme)